MVYSKVNVLIAMDLYNIFYLCKGQNCPFCMGSHIYNVFNHVPVFGFIS